MTYDQQVRHRFPLPDGYREIKPDEDLPAVIYDRVDCKPHNVVGWSQHYDGQIELEFGELTVHEFPCWYVAQLTF